MPIVIIDLLSDDPIPEPIDGVVVEFYDTIGTFITSGTSDVGGQVMVTLPAAFYDLLFYKQGVSILPKQPQRIQVLTQIPPNEFAVTGHVRTMPQSPDPLKCRVSGHLINSVGQPTKNFKLTFGPTEEVIVLSGNLVTFDDQITVVPDENGDCVFDLLRKVKYEAFVVYKDTFLGTEPGRLCLQVPDLPAIPLQDLMFPVPVHFDFSANTISIPTGTTDNSLTLTITYSDGNARQESTPWARYMFTLSDPDVVDFSIAGNTVVLVAKQAGTCTITISRDLNDAVQFDPEPPLLAEQLVVTVT